MLHYLSLYCDISYAMAGNYIVASCMFAGILVALIEVSMMEKLWCKH